MQFLLCVLIVKVFINHCATMVFTKRCDCSSLIYIFYYNVGLIHQVLRLSILLVKNCSFLDFSFAISMLLMKLIGVTFWPSKCYINLSSCASASRSYVNWILLLLRVGVNFKPLNRMFFLSLRQGCVWQVEKFRFYIFVLVNVMTFIVSWCWLGFFYVLCFKVFFIFLKFFRFLKMFWSLLL